MGAQHSYLQNNAVVDSGHGLVYFQDLFSISGPGGLKISGLQNMPSVYSTGLKLNDNLPKPWAKGLQNQFSLSGPGGLKFSTLQDLAVVDTGHGLVYY